MIHGHAKVSSGVSTRVADQGLSARHQGKQEQHHDDQQDALHQHLGHGHPRPHQPGTIVNEIFRPSGKSALSLIRNPGLDGSPPPLLALPLRSIITMPPTDLR